MNNISLKVNDVLREIQDRNEYPKKELGDDVKIVNGLGFSSLDVAELIAVLEMELGVDPFSQGVSIMSVNTIGELHALYNEYVNKPQTEKVI